MIEWDTHQSPSGLTTFHVSRGPNHHWRFVIRSVHEEGGALEMADRDTHAIHVCQTVTEAQLLAEGILMEEARKRHADSAAFAKSDSSRDYGRQLCCSCADMVETTEPDCEGFYDDSDRVWCVGCAGRILSLVADPMDPHVS